MVLLTVVAVVPKRRPCCLLLSAFTKRSVLWTCFSKNWYSSRLLQDKLTNRRRTLKYRYALSCLLSLPLYWLAECRSLSWTEWTWLVVLNTWTKLRVDWSFLYFSSHILKKVGKTPKKKRTPVSLLLLSSLTPLLLSSPLFFVFLQFWTSSATKHCGISWWTTRWHHRRATNVSHGWFKLAKNRKMALWYAHALSSRFLLVVLILGTKYFYLGHWWR